MRIITVSATRSTPREKWVRGIIGLLLVLFIAATLAGPASAAKASPNSRGTFSLDFVGSEVVDVLKALSAQSGVNIVVAGGIKGETTVSLRNVTLEEALRLVTATNGLDYAWVDVAYVVGLPEQVRGLRVKSLASRVVTLNQIAVKDAQDLLTKIAPEVSVTPLGSTTGPGSLVLIGPEAALGLIERQLRAIDVPALPTTKMVGIQHVKAQAMCDMLKGTFTEGTIQLGPQQNTLLITADPVQMNRIMEFVKAVDVVPAVGQSKLVIYDIKYAHPLELKAALSTRFGKDLQIIDCPRSDTPIVQQTTGADTTNLKSPLATTTTSAAGGASTAKEGAGQTGVSQVSRTEKIMLIGAEYTVEKALELLSDIDIASKQVRIKVMVTRVNRDNLKQLGVDWFSAEGAAASGILTGVGYSENPVNPANGEQGVNFRNKELGRFFRTPFDFVGALRALQSSGNAKVLAEPTVCTLDGRQVAFHSGQKIFYQTTIGYNTSGNAILDIREIDVGVTLIVTPQINTDGQITLTLSPKVSSASFREELGTALPIVDERTAIATVRVKDGESIVLAGLMEDNESTSTSKVPLLGDIPFFGNAFKSTKKQVTHDELVITVTPEVVK